MSENPKTELQRNSLHKWCELVAVCLNRHGLRFEYTVLKTKSIPYTKEIVKEHIWKPVLKALTDKVSTEDMSTVEPNDVRLAIAGHFATERAITLPEWPSRHTQGEAD